MTKLKDNLLLVLLFAGYETAIYLSNDAYLPAVPIMTQELHTTYAVMQLAVATWFLGSALVNLILGPLSDRVGRRPILLVGGLVFIIVTAGCALTHNIYSLLVLRLIQGATIPSMIVASYATVYDLFNREEAIYIGAMIGSLTILSPAFGPLAGAMLLHFSNWRWIFGVLAVWGVLMVLGLFLKMPETKTIREKQPFMRTILQYKNIMQNKTFMLLNVSVTSSVAGLIVWLTAGPFLVITHLHYSTFTFGIMQAMIFSTNIIGAHAIKPLMSWIRLNTIVWCGLTLSLLGEGYALTAILYSASLWDTVIGLMCLAGGTGMVFPILNRLAIEASDEPMSARVSMNFWLMSLAGILGSVLISRVYNGELFSFNIIVFVLSLIAMLAYAGETIIQRCQNHRLKVSS